ncbi:MAG: hypothetical protein ABIA21_02190 [Candidatus Aenigmatarchaeota archaeon]
MEEEKKKFQCRGEYDPVKKEFMTPSRNCLKRVSKLEKEAKKYDEMRMVEKSQEEQKE